MELESLEKTFIVEVFKKRTWTKLLNPLGNVHAKVIREFFANAFVEGDCINCWLRGRKGVPCHKEVHLRDLGGSTNDPTHIPPV